jgi:hypothetical protein
MDYNNSKTNAYISHSGPNKLCQLVQQQFPQISIITLPRKYFNDEVGKGYINNYGLQEDAAGLLVGVATKLQSCVITAINNIVLIPNHTTL